MDADVELFTRWPKITVISMNGNVLRAEATTQEPHTGTFRWYTSWGYSELASYDTNGVEWIEGWFDDGSTEALALKAAAKLTRSAA